MIRAFILTLFIFTSGCVPQKISDSRYAPTHKEHKTSLLEILQTDYKDEVSDFIKKMPKSDFIRRGVIYFSKSTPEKVIDVEVLDFDLDNSTLVILKKDLIRLLHPSCKSMLNNHSLSNIHLNGRSIYGESEENVVIYDIPNCGIVSRISKNNYSFRPGPNRFVLFQNRNFKVLNIDGNEYLSGNLFKKITDAHLGEKYLLLLDADNNLISVDTINKIMLPSQKIDADEVHFGRKDLFIRRGEKIYLYDYNEINEKSKSYDVKNCYLKGYDSFCSSNERVLNSDKALNYDNYFIIKDKNTLKSLNLNEEIYKKTIYLTEYIPKACRQNDHILFYDIDNTIKKISLSNYSVEILSGEIKCTSFLDYKLGEFYENENVILKIGETVNRDEEDAMIKREMDENNIYIFFESVALSS